MPPGRGQLRSDVGQKRRMQKRTRDRPRRQAQPPALMPRPFSREVMDRRGPRPARRAAPKEATSSRLIRGQHHRLGTDHAAVTHPYPAHPCLRRDHPLHAVLVADGPGRQMRGQLRPDGPHARTGQQSPPGRERRQARHHPRGARLQCRVEQNPAEERPRQPVEKIRGEPAVREEARSRDVACRGRIEGQSPPAAQHGTEHQETEPPQVGP